MKVFNDLKTRGVEDVLIAVTDGLKGMPEALSAVFPQTTLQTCIVHLIRNSLDYAAWDKRRELAKALNPIYQALNAEVAEQALDAFDLGLGANNIQRWGCLEACMGPSLSGVTGFQAVPFTY